MKMFNRIGEFAGTLAICKPCGEAQQAACREAKECAIMKSKIYAYHMATAEKDLSHLESHNIVQLSAMELIFDYRLRTAIEELGEYETVIEDGKKVKRPKVTTQRIYELMNFMNNLNKSPIEMQITRRTQENIDLEYAKLLEAQISDEKSNEFKAKILEMMADWQGNKAEAEKMRQQDEAISDWVNRDQKEGDQSGDLKISKIGGNPFGSNENE